MTDYVEARLKLSLKQLQRLAHGQKVRLKASDLDGDVFVLLTPTQATKVVKARKASKGLDLKLSEAQIQANAENKIGGGVFTDAMRSIGAFVRKAGSKAMPLARQLASQVLNNYGPKAADFAIDQVGSKLSGVLGNNDTLDQYINQGKDWGKRLSRSQLEALSRGLVSGSGIKGRGLFLPGTV